MKADLRDRADRISDTVSAYHEFKKAFTTFSKIWKEKGGEIAGVAFDKADGSAFYLSLFDGSLVKAEFSMIIDRAGNPWGRVVYQRDETVIDKFYFDQGGYLFPKPERRLDGQAQNITSQQKFPEIMICFMEKYLETFRDG